MTQGRFEFPSLAKGHLTIGTQAMWQDATQINYFGVGGDPVSDDQSQYRIQTTNVVGYFIGRLSDSLTADLDLGWLDRPRVMEAGGTFKSDDPDSRIAYPDDPAMNLAAQPSFLHAQASLTSDTRNRRGYPTSGAVLRAVATRFDDRDTGTFSFMQYEGEAVGFVPLGRHTVFAMRGWTVYSSVDSGNQIPFYLLPTVGGNSIRAYRSYQFHDLHSLVASAELRVALLEHLDAAGFIDAGNVAPEFSALNLDRRAIGGGLRLHTERTMLARADFSYGSEGWRVLVRTQEPFNPRRLNRALAAIPFFP
jgi:outer membrane protein assembly factor BamA